MEILTSEAAVLLALGEGPSCGVGIMDRLQDVGRPLGAGTLYPLLRQLEKAGLVRGWVEEGRRRVGRPRRFLELTRDGVAALGRVRQQLRAIGGPATAPGPPATVVRRMGVHLRRGFRVSAMARRLRDAGAR